MKKENGFDDVIRSDVLEDGRMYDVTKQDIDPYLEDAKIRRSLNPHALSQNKYKEDSFGCLHAAKIPLGFVELMSRGQCCTDGKRYNLMSNDTDEVRRTYLHIQCCHKELMVVNGKPFTKNRIQ